MSTNIHDKDDKTYIVLGAPHSATSFIAKCLEDAGVSMGSNMAKLYQDSNFVYINQQMIRQAGGRWNKPPSEKKILAIDLSQRIVKLIKWKKKKFWGFKDPRTSLTAKAYFPHLDGDAYLICCFRKPDKVVKSFGGNKGVNRKLIDRYNRSIVSAIKEFCKL